MKPLVTGCTHKFSEGLTSFEKTTHAEFLSGLFYLLNLDIREAFDPKEPLRGARDQTLCR
jgi:hypothetical protein